MVVEADMYDGDSVGPACAEAHYRARRAAALLIATTTPTTVRARGVPIWGKHYIIPRWEKPGHTQFAYSPGDDRGARRRAPHPGDDAHAS
jgi:hypothetical protein